MANTPNTPKVSDTLRELIDQKHARALEALKELEPYLSDAPLVPGLAGLLGQPETGKPSPAPVGKRPKHTKAVLAIISKEYATVMQLVERTGIEEKRVRGVLNSDRLKGKLQTKSIDGVKAYHLIADKRKEQAEDNGDG